MQKNNDNNHSHNSIQNSVISSLQMGKLRSRGLISFLSITERKEASPEPTSLTLGGLSL